jgi:hypothetical protein
MPLVRRLAFTAQVERPFGARRLVSRTSAAVVRAGDAIPLQSLVWYGGPVSAPGYDYHSIAGSTGLSQRLELRTPVPFPAIPLGRFGRVPASATLAPWVHLALVQGARLRAADGPVLPPGFAQAADRWQGHPSVGVGLLTFFDVLRLDVARGLRDGRWSFYLDVTRDFWRVL